MTEPVPGDEPKGDPGSAPPPAAGDCDDREVPPYVWLANSSEGTVSKVNSETLVEEARYATRAGGGGRPSRVSVNLNRDAVVANRDGGLTMIRANPDECSDPSRTSTGRDDVRPFPDGCVAWSTAADGYSQQRPVAFTPGTFNPATCRYEGIQLWTARSVAAGEEIEVLLLDGETGDVEETVLTGVRADWAGLYGGAVDGEGNFWGLLTSGRMLLRVGSEDLQIRTWPIGQRVGYGITVDRGGNPWICSGSVSRFNVASETWESIYDEVSAASGCNIGANNQIWVSGTGERLAAINTQTLELEQEFSLPGFAKGICTGVGDDVWAVSNREHAWRVNVETGELHETGGFFSLYTYSDCMGGQLRAVSAP